MAQLCWTARASTYSENTYYHVYKVPLLGGSGTTLATDTTFPGDVAVNSMWRTGLTPEDS